MAENLILDGINNVKFLKTFLCDQLSCKIEDLDFKKVHSFVLEHRNLLRINCLWPLINLTHLSLANNRIRKIENLESLTSLKELNLSFNEISKIENLQSLVNLEKLLLNSNRINLLDNLDCLKHLKILNVGANCIKDSYFPFYLCQFKELRALIIDENPCYSESNSIDEYLISLMPNLLDLNHRKISDKERYSARVHYRMKILGSRENRIRDIERPGSFFSKYKTLKSRKTDFCIMTGDEFFDGLFKKFSPLLQLSKEGENFQRINDKLKKNIVASLEGLQAKKNVYIENFKNFEETLKDLEMKSLNIKRKYVSNYKSNFKDCQTEEDEAVEKYLTDFRMSLLAKECNAHYHQKKLLNDMNRNLSIEIQKFHDDMKNVHEKIGEEINSYVKQMARNIESCFQWKTNVPYEFQPTVKENVLSNLNLPEFFSVFKGNSTIYLTESETRYMEIIREWKDNVAKIVRKNVTKHRKAVAEIIETIESIKLLSSSCKSNLNSN